MTTNREAAEDLYQTLKPDAVREAAAYILARTPADLQQDMSEVIEESLVDAGGEPGQNEPPTVIDAPMIWQTGTGVGSVFECTMGNWTGDPDSRTYRWMLDGNIMAGATNPTYTLASDGFLGMTFTCIMTASNTVGTSEPVTSNAVVAA